MAEHHEMKNVCGICLLHFKEPKILPCFHTFCMKCLEDNLRITAQSEMFSCPTCRASIPIPTDGVKCFQTNFYVTANDRMPFGCDCDACGRREVACYKCKQCDQTFCESCRKIHLRMTSSREHDILPISPMINRHTRLNGNIKSCERHPSEKIKMVCKDCSELVCRVCQATLHKEHSCSDIAEEASDRRQQLSKLIDISDNKLKEIENDIHVVRRQAESKHAFFNDQMTLLRKEGDSLISNISKKLKSFEDEIKQLNEEQYALSIEMTENQKLKTLTLKQAIGNWKEALDTDEDITLLRNFDCIVEYLNEIKVTLTPVVSGRKLMENVEQCASWLKMLNEQTLSSGT